MKTKLNAKWIVGFVDGEGCFMASLIKNKTIKYGYQIQMEFVVTQHKRDVQVLYALKSYFKCGQVGPNKKKKGNVWAWRVRGLQQHLDNVIPFFEKHPLKTKKQIEFIRFRKLCLRMQKKEHLTPEGFPECYALAETLRYDSTDMEYFVEKYENPN
uniref:Hypothetical LAGLIDADG-1 homing endonuclease n=1 Tax=Chlorotetraedron incus TaxID=162317 RepID=A0A076VF09_9CHLO|nr:hypothetical LAGLIDADG-1 homing endonuclease [Chlorotetraedron incus]AIK29118.1 hypothetical LAGLIDADG-1 homing endonuclease [Chlorotetraedron incus]